MPLTVTCTCGYVLRHEPVFPDVDWYRELYDRLHQSCPGCSRPLPTPKQFRDVMNLTIKANPALAKEPPYGLAAILTHRARIAKVEAGGLEA